MYKSLFVKYFIKKKSKQHLNKPLFEKISFEIKGKSF